jgi:hypothetical protein
MGLPKNPCHRVFFNRLILKGSDQRQWVVQKQMFLSRYSSTDHLVKVKVMDWLVAAT